MWFFTYQNKATVCTAALIKIFSSGWLVKSNTFHNSLGVIQADWFLAS